MVLLESEQVPAAPEGRGVEPVGSARASPFAGGPGRWRGGARTGGCLTGRVVLQFLTELTRLFQKCRSSGSVYITLKKCKQPPGPGQRGAAAGRGQPGGRLLSGSPDSRAQGRGGAGKCGW